jgi:hypothetical protein
VALPGTTAQKQKASTKAKYRFFAAAFLYLVDKSRYIKILEDLEKNFAMGAEHYPENVTKVYNMVDNYKQQQHHMGWLFNDSEGVSFANMDNGKGDAYTSHIRCYSCNKMGHYVNECPTRTPRPPAKACASMLVMVDEGGDSESGSDGYASINEFSFHQGDKYVNQKWILFDNQSTADTFCNLNLLSNIHESESSTKINCNVGTR